MEIKTINNVPAVMEFNFEEVKGKLEIFSEKYVGLVVTEENLKEMTETKNELARLEKEIDKYRLDNKKIMEQPIKEFENKCKELIAVIKNVSDPIRSQIENFEEKRKQEKESEINVILTEVIKEHNLNEKYAAQLTLIPKYLNKGEKLKDVEKDLKARAELLKNSQEQEEQLKKIQEERIDFIQKTIEKKNQELNLNLKISSFMYLVNKELSEIIEEIDIIFEKEVEKNKKIETIEEMPEREVKKEETKLATTSSYVFTIKDLTKDDLERIKNFLEEEFYSFEFKKI